MLAALGWLVGWLAGWLAAIDPTIGFSGSSPRLLAEFSLGCISY